MLIPLRQLVQKHNLKITGVIHVGAHFAQEHGAYLACGINKVVYIEASAKTFHRLCRLNLQGDVQRIHIALGEHEGSATMYTETANNGQSSSLLKPKTHLEHYPDIPFTGTEVVDVKRLDSLALNGYNMLNIDVQGAELMVLKGGPKTLENIDVIYVEVNKEEVYENCPMVEELDKFLEGFKRIETLWTNQGWGDALYIRTAKRNIADLPELFRPRHPMLYPSYNKVEFERWFYENFKTIDNSTERTYLPIFWTNYYCKHKWGKDKRAIAQLQIFLNKLDKKKKYYTIVQYDDGILNDVSHLDLKIFSMGGGRVDYPLPLIAEPIPIPRRHIEKDIFCSFVGRVTHPCRQAIIDQLKGKVGYYISERNHTVQQFADILERSKFVLCPRGYGKTSFRIQEALQFDAIPVYVSDEWIEPHYDFSYGWRLKPEDDIDGFLKRMDGITEIEGFYEKYFTYEANKKLILENL